jgi:hypothetical protein
VDGGAGAQRHGGRHVVCEPGSGATRSHWRPVGGAAAAYGSSVGARNAPRAAQTLSLRMQPDRALKSAVQEAITADEVARSAQGLGFSPCPAATSRASPGSRPQACGHSGSTIPIQANIPAGIPDTTACYASSGGASAATPTTPAVFPANQNHAGRPLLAHRLLGQRTAPIRAAGSSTAE